MQHCTRCGLATVQGLLWELPDQPVFIPSSTDIDVLSRPDAQGFNAPVRRLEDDIAQRHLEGEKMPIGVEVGVEWRATHMTFTKETRVCVCLKKNITSLFINLTKVPKLNQCNRDSVCQDKTRGGGGQAFACRPETLEGWLSAWATDCASGKA